MELVACLSTGKGTWGHVNRLSEDPRWTKIILITNDFGKENFQKNEKIELIPLKLSQGLRELRDEIKKVLQDKITGTEVAINLISGTGREHMALISAILKLGKGIRLFALTKEGIEEI